MKPRLHSALLTDEDLQIWVRIEACWNGDRHTKPWAWGMTQDRRDAELMLEAQQHPNWVRSEYGHFIRSIGQSIKANPSHWRE